MECLPAEPFIRTPIDRIADERAPDSSKLRTDLVFESADELDLDDRPSSKLLDYPVTERGESRPSISFSNDLLPELMCRLREIMGELARFLLGRTGEHGEVTPVGGPILELFDQRVPAPLTERKEEKSARIAVDTVDYSRVAFLRGKHLAQNVERVRRSAVGERNGEDPRRFIDDDEVAVFVNYGEYPPSARGGAPGCMAAVPWARRCVGRACVAPRRTDIRRYAASPFGSFPVCALSARIPAGAHFNTIAPVRGS